MSKWYLDDYDVVKLRHAIELLNSLVEALIEEPDKMTEEEEALAHEECKNGEGSNYSEAEWAEWLADIRRRK